MTRRQREILRARRLIRDQEEFVSDGVRGVWRYKDNATLYTVRMYGMIVFLWAEVTGKWYEVRQKHAYEVPPTLAIARDDIRPEEGTTLLDYDAIQELWHDPSTPPELTALLKVSP